MDNQLNKLTDIDTLIISIENIDSFDGILSDCTFPKLQKILIGSLIELSRPLAAFLSRHHANLQELTIQNDWHEFLTYDPVHSGHIVLPNLRFFSGPASVFVELLNSAPTALESVMIEWYLGTTHQIVEDFRAPFMALATSTARNTCTTIVCRISGGSVDRLVGGIAEWCPHVVNLSIVPHWKTKSKIGIEGLYEPFKKFTQLSKFSFFGVLLDVGAIENKLKILGGNTRSLREFELVQKGGMTKRWLRNDNEQGIWSKV